jgi:hypothetical protein
MLAYLLIALTLNQPAPGPQATAEVLVPPTTAVETDLCAWAERIALEPPCRRPEDCRAYQEWAQRFGRPGAVPARPPAPRAVPLGPWPAPALPDGPRRLGDSGATCLAGR